MKIYFILPLLACALTACMHNRTNDYVNAENNPPLKTPADITPPNFKASYPIPPKLTSAVVAAPNLVPPGYDAEVKEAKKATD